MFIDSAKIYIKAGDGGNGKVSFHTEKYIAKGGPDGGDGGKGGNVVFQVEDGIRTLIDFRYKRKYTAQNGENGGSRNCSGKCAEDIIIKIPPGTLIKDESGSILKDMTNEGQTEIIARGGKGGAGNQHFATPTRQVPQFAKPGQKGQELTVTLELKLLADVGLVGYPNAGKSTILSTVTAAKPKIANYPFTTLVPNLGVVSIETNNSFVIADIPGLIEGAHEGVGLGHEFLKHIERTKVIIHVVDVAGIDNREPLEDFRIINEELKMFNPKLANKYQVVAANKIDLPDSEVYVDDFKAKLEAEGYKVFLISAATNKGLKELMLYVSEKLQELPNVIFIDEGLSEKVYKPQEMDDVKVYKDEDIFVVEGEWARRLVLSINFESYESLQYFQRAMKLRGVIGELEELGVEEGDTVRVFEFEFDYVK